MPTGTSKTPKRTAQGRALMRGEVTGRDGYIINKALAYASTAIAGLPDDAQEKGDASAMRDLLAALVPDVEERDNMLLNALGHLEGKPGGGPAGRVQSPA